MNRIQKLFEKKKEIFSVYFTAGFPELNDTVFQIESLLKHGVDMIEIGIPFSDPLADGPVIQQSSEQALKNGMTLKLLFEQLQNVRKNNSDAPLLLMGYLNPVLRYGVENFCKKANEVGIDGVILPDLPLKEYINEYLSIFEKYGVIPVFLITPQTSDERIRLIDKYSKGFIYMVSSAGTTGVKEGISERQSDYFNRVKQLNLSNPLMIGFGISNRKDFTKACEFARGAIIGSAYIRAANSHDGLEGIIEKFVKSIR